MKKSPCGISVLYQLLTMLLFTAVGAHGQSCAVHLFAINQFGAQITATAVATVGTLPSGEAGPNPVFPGTDFILEANSDSTCHLNATFTFTAASVTNSCVVQVTTVDPGAQTLRAQLDCPGWRWQQGNLWVDGLEQGQSMIFKGVGFLTGNFTFKPSPPSNTRTAIPLGARPESSPKMYSVSSDWIACPASSSCWGSFGCRSAGDQITSGGLQTQEFRSPVRLVQSHPGSSYEWFVEANNSGAADLRYRIWALCSGTGGSSDKSPPAARTGTAPIPGKK